MTGFCDLPGFTDPEGGMNAGKTLFAQVMESIPWETFGRIIAKHKGDCAVTALPAERRKQNKAKSHPA
jgi:hypothetical protein